MRPRVPIEEIVEGDRDLPKDRSQYVGRVLRLGPGDEITAFDPDRALEADGVVVAVGAGARAVTVRLGAVRPARVKAGRPVTIVQALGKGDKMDAVVRDATELGATRVVPVTSDRCVARAQDGAARGRRWRRIAVEAARQCLRGDAPRVDEVRPLIEAVRAIAAEDTGTSAWRGVLVPGAPPRLGQALRDLSGDAAIAFVVGPEGGLSRSEIDACEAAGFVSFGLGPLVLRTETVCAAVLGAVLVLGGGAGA